MPESKDTTDAKPDATVAQPTGIRPYRDGDLKTVRMMIGTSVMEGLARANKQSTFRSLFFLFQLFVVLIVCPVAYFHPLILTLYIVTALGLDYYMGWLPRDDIWWSPVSVLTGFGTAALPLLGVVEL